MTYKKNLDFYDLSGSMVSSFDPQAWRKMLDALSSKVELQMINIDHHIIDSKNKEMMSPPLDGGTNYADDCFKKSMGSDPKLNFQLVLNEDGCGFTLIFLELKENK